MTRRLGRGAVAAALSVSLLAALAGTAAAHGGSLRSSSQPLTVPTWLFLMTGGAAVGASFLLASFVTDRALIGAVEGYSRRLPDGWTGVARPVVRALGVVGLVGVLYFAFTGPAEGPNAALRNVAILVVWAGWWAGYVASVYLLGNTWPTLNPFRTVADLLPTLGLDYPERLGAWPSVAGLLVLIWIEVVSPLADDPRLLGTVVLGYAAVTVAGAAAFGSDTWFGTVDPVSRVFEFYGRVAPFAADADGPRVRLPAMGLTDATGIEGRDDVAFVVAVLWVTTYDGLVTTPAWADLARAVVDGGVPASVLYPAALLVGYGVFLGVYWLAARGSRRTADTYVTVGALARRFAPSLLAIAAGYHLAHFLSYLLTLSPALVAALASPVSPPATPQTAVLPAWFGGVELAFVLLGHVLAIWVAHATAYDLFPGRIQAVRSQYPFIAVMVAYTMVSFWIVAEPEQVPPFL